MTTRKATLARFTLLGSLYFAQGLPFGFFTQAVPVILRTQGVSLGNIGLTSLLTLPWALKFVWAPVVDRRWWPAIGRRRSWILPMQLSGTLVLAGLALVPGESVAVLMAAMVTLNLVAATQDIATDGMAVDILPADERGFANGLQVAGYRLGMIIGGGVLLGLHDTLGRHGTFAAMAVLTALSSVPVIVLREPPPPPVEPTHRGGLHFVQRPGALRLLALIALYKAGEAFAQGMLRPFLVDQHLSLTDVGWLLGTVGFIAGMLGALVGGGLVTRIGRRRALLGFGVVQVLAVAGYAYLAITVPSRAELYVWCGVEHFASGMATAALFTCMMDWSATESAATDYTVQASTVVIATGLASTVSGFSAGALGYAPHFALAAALCVAAVVGVAVLFPRTGVGAA